jgi:hypothetical protein
MIRSTQNVSTLPDRDELRINQGIRIPDFKWAVVADLPDEWTLTWQAILDWVHQQTAQEVTP